MFAPSFARVVRSTASVSATPAGPLCRAALSTASTPFHPLHQRRYSSSKSSVPPSNKKKPGEELERNAATQFRGQERDAKSKDMVMEIPLASSTNNVPHVPSTTHLQEDEVRLSSFFALHRPIPFHREAWQQPASMDMFDALFDQPEPSDVRSIQRTNKTLSEFVQGLYAGIDTHDETQAEAIFFQEEAEQYDGPPTEESIMFHASQLPHFVPPPPPVAFDPSALQPHPFTTLVMDGHITEIALSSEQAERPTTFREHVRRRRGGMLLISVKRQRKLKMKKHKYKKLMKRTRLLRRKLDRT